jgi:predicted amidohydrolase YtcJ
LAAFAQIRAFERDHNLQPLRHRIEHVQIIHPQDAGLLAEMDVIASMQPIHATSDMRMADQYWGERSNLAYAWRTQLDQGAVLAFGSDAPVEEPNPFWGLHAAVTRCRADGSPSSDGWYPEQKLGLFEALHAYTSGAAYAAGLESRQGKIAPGYLADLIVLDKDPFACELNEIRELHPVSTMVSGEWVFRE